MKTLFDNDQFCRETFPTDLSRDQIVTSMMRARRHARISRGLRNSSILISLILAAAVLLHKPSAPSSKQQTAQTQPACIIQTAPFDGIIHTVPLNASNFTFPAEASFAIVHTIPNNHQDLTDDQLLAHFKSRAVALVKTIAGVRLEFLDQSASGSQP